MDVEKQFATEIAKPADEIDIEYCALLVSARLQNDPDAFKATLELDAQVNAFLTDHPDFAETHALNAQYLTSLVGGILGYRGDNVEYYSPDNSLLDRVIQNRLGIPISLAAIYSSVGKRLGINVSGVNFPSHFLIRVQEPDGSEVIVDPFAHQILNADHVKLIRETAEQRLGGSHPSWLANAHPHDVLVRMLQNAKAIYNHLEEYEAMLICLKFQIAIRPTDETFLNELEVLSGHK